MSNTAAARLAELGITLPEPAKPVASYVGFVRHGNLLILSGQLPFVDGKVTHTGLLGRDVGIEDAAAAARVCAINLLAQVNVACEGNLERVKRCVRLGVFVASMPDFHDHPKVANGASDLMVAVFGEKGAHARAAVGVAVLPMNACVEVEGMFEIE